MNLRAWKAVPVHCKLITEPFYTAFRTGWCHIGGRTRETVCLSGTPQGRCGIGKTARTKRKSPLSSKKNGVLPRPPGKREPDRLHPLHRNHAQDGSRCPMIRCPPSCPHVGQILQAKAPGLMGPDASVHRCFIFPFGVPKRGPTAFVWFDRGSYTPTAGLMRSPSRRAISIIALDVSDCHWASPQGTGSMRLSVRAATRQRRFTSS